MSIAHNCDEEVSYLWDGLADQRMPSGRVGKFLPPGGKRRRKPWEETVME